MITIVYTIHYHGNIHVLLYNTMQISDHIPVHIIQ